MTSGRFKNYSFLQGAKKMRVDLPPTRIFAVVFGLKKGYSKSVKLLGTTQASIRSTV